jgi:hypothetical protein
MRVNGPAGGLRGPVNQLRFRLRIERTWADHGHVQVALPACLALGDRPEEPRGLDAAVSTEAPAEILLERLLIHGGVEHTVWRGMRGT